eukprot:Rmarinus@m.17380
MFRISRLRAEYPDRFVEACQKCRFDFLERYQDEEKLTVCLTCFRTNRSAVDIKAVFPEVFQALDCVSLNQSQPLHHKHVSPKALSPKHRRCSKDSQSAAGLSDAFSNESPAATQNFVVAWSNSSDSGSTASCAASSSPLSPQPRKPLPRPRGDACEGRHLASPRAVEGLLMSTPALSRSSPHMGSPQSPMDSPRTPRAHARSSPNVCAAPGGSPSGFGGGREKERDRGIDGRSPLLGTKRSLAVEVPQSPEHPLSPQAQSQSAPCTPPAHHLGFPDLDDDGVEVVDLLHFRPNGEDPRSPVVVTERCVLGRLPSHKPMGSEPGGAGRSSPPPRDRPPGKPQHSCPGGAHPLDPRLHPHAHTSARALDSGEKVPVPPLKPLGPVSSLKSQQMVLTSRSARFRWRGLAKIFQRAEKRYR